ncbi:restriction endonuclease subunit S [Acetobacter pomorum]|uniref:Restriction endonuclease subunit S n=1 Tax=Acetobacter pomorum TaxID=65959 RepID=A0A2G4R8N9_9PROT|nr:restriction endonuclease subunit S [Acetobacter pomorum]PHY92902.1 restriction endonuclease subunit S [Acetobacter pomorum]GBR46749.1 restriction endonuclease S subunit [Acetobacter pomorum DSM 11825]
MLPEGWDLCRLEDLATVERGKFSARPRNDPKFFGGNIPFVQTGDVTNASIYVKNYSQTLNKEGLSVSRIFPKGTILMTIAANIGDTAIASFDLACPDSLVGIIAKKNKADTYWLRIFLGAQKTTLENYAPQNAQKNINLQTLKPLEILTPPLPEQKKIAAILSTWDRAIEGTEKLLANSQQQKKALMQQLLTGKKRLPGFTGEWKQHRLSDCCHIVMGSSPKSEFYNETGKGLPLLQGNADIKNRFSYPRIFTSEITKECNVGDILLSVRAPVGTVSIAVHHACIGRGISSIRVKKGNSQEFAYQYFLSIEDRWDRLAQGSTFEAVNGDDIKKLTIQLPSLPEQKAIAAVLSTTDEEIAAIESDLSRLRQEKKALMQQLLTGKRRVKVD